MTFLDWIYSSHRIILKNRIKMMQIKTIFNKLPVILLHFRVNHYKVKSIFYISKSHLISCVTFFSFSLEGQVLLFFTRSSTAGSLLVNIQIFIPDITYSTFPNVLSEGSPSRNPLI